MISKVKKRNGELAPFNETKIEKAVYKALTFAKEGNGERAKEIADKVYNLLLRRFSSEETPHVEQIQDIVEEMLIMEGLVETARAYILYREKRREIRETVSEFDESTELIENYIDEMDWQIKENANMTYSLQGLNQYTTSHISKKYWLNKIYPDRIRKAAQNQDFHIHDLNLLATYCCGWDLQDLLMRGFGGVPSKVESKPPKHLRPALGQIVNFFFTLQGECYSEDTQVLTKEGWKYFYEVTKKDKVFTLNSETEEVELQEPTRFYEFKYDGKLYNFKSKKLDLLVTPNHNMAVRQYNPDLASEEYKFKFVKAKDFNPDTHFIPKQAIWKGKEEEYFTLPSIWVEKYSGYTGRYRREKVEAKEIPMSDWIPFFGFWLAEGCTSLQKRERKGRNKPYYEYQVRITQNKGESAEEFKKILNKLPFEYIVKETGEKLEFCIWSKQLFSYLRNFGGSGEKFIPEEVKGLAKDHLSSLLEWMMKGDGYEGNGNIEYYTKSKKLADDVQEVILKLGLTANIYKKNKGSFSWFKVCNSRSKHFRISRENIKEVEYKGKVYCLEVPNHTLYVRRNGRASWCGNSAGAQAMSNFDTFLAPFIRRDNLDYKQVKQALQEFAFNCMVPTRVGFQTPFINISLDVKVPAFLKDQPIIIGGEPQKETYGEFQKEMDLFNSAFYEVLMEGDAKGRVFTFPIPTISIAKDFDWENKSLDKMWEATAKYGINYFSNFVQSDMNPEDFRSMCCRLRLDNQELVKRGGGLFGSQPLTGSVGVVTINMPRIGYLSKTRKDFFYRLEEMMDLAKESLEIKRKVLDDFIEKGLYPYTRNYLSSVKKLRGSYFGNHFSTIGLIGMNEAALNFIGENIGSEKGKKFSLEVLEFMRDKLVNYQEETGNLYNLEATPGEGASFRQARVDKEKYPNIITAGTKDAPYYTNSVHLPVGYTDDPFEALDLQDDLQQSFTGGTVLHLFLGEKVDDSDSAKNLVRKVFENYRLPYITLSPTFSICPKCGYLKGERFYCPNCRLKTPKKVVKNI